MRIHKLTIQKRSSWENENPNRFVAVVEYEDRKSQMAIVLTPEISVKLLELCAPLIAEHSRQAMQEVADAITLTVSEAKQPLLEAVTLQR